MGAYLIQKQNDQKILLIEGEFLPTSATLPLPRMRAGLPESLPGGPESACGAGGGGNLPSPPAPPLEFPYDP